MCMISACDMCGTVYHPDLLVSVGGVRICPNNSCGDGVVTQIPALLLPMQVCLANKGYRVSDSYILLPHTSLPCIEIHFRDLHSFPKLPEGFDNLAAANDTPTIIARYFDTTVAKVFIYEAWFQAITELFQWVLDLPPCNEKEESAA